MPHFTLLVSPGGPIIDAFVAVSEARAAALKAAGEQIPAPIRIRALVDTGASCSCVDPSVLKILNLTPTGQTSVNTPSTGSSPHAADQYDVGILVPPEKGIGAPLVIRNIPVVALELLAAQGFHALLGRDILSLCLLS